MVFREYPAALLRGYLFEEVKGNLYRRWQYSASGLTKEMVGDGLNMLRSEGDPHSPRTEEIGKQKY